MIDQPSREPLLTLSKAKGDFVVLTSRSSGPGGQNVNKRETKVCIRHPASGATATCQEHRTQEQNKAAAFRRCVESETFRAWLRLELARRGLISEGATSGDTGPTGSRGAKIRTYHGPRGTVTDHRTGTVAPLDRVLDGDLSEFLGEVRQGLAQTTNGDLP